MIKKYILETGRLWRLLMLGMIVMLLNGCNIGTNNDPYTKASRVLSEVIKSENPFADSKAFSFHRELCYGGTAKLNSCKYQTDEKNALYVAPNLISFVDEDKSYDIKWKKHLRVGQMVYFLTTEDYLWICDLSKKVCKLSDVNYKFNDFIAIDADVSVCKDNSECINSLVAYSSLLVLTKPISEPADSGGRRLVQTYLGQIFINAPGENRTLISKDMGAYLENLKPIINDVVIAPDHDENPRILNFTFGEVSSDSASILLIYDRVNNKGGALQFYTVGFNYGRTFIKDNVSSNKKRAIGKKNSLDHFTIFTPVAQKPVENSEVVQSFFRDVRHVAGGPADEDNNFSYCTGMNTSCVLTVMGGYKELANLNPVTQLEDGAVSFALFIGSLETINAASLKAAAALAKKSGKLISVLRFGANALPLLGMGGTMSALMVFGEDLHNSLFALTTEDPWQRLKLTASVASIISFPDSSLQCKQDFYKELAAREKNLFQNMNVIYILGGTMYNLFNSIGSCRGVTLAAKDQSLMEHISLDTYANFRSTTISFVYRKFYIESNSEFNQTIDLIADGQGDFVVDENGAQADKDQPYADIVLRSPNCQAACEMTNLTDGVGNYITDLSGEKIKVFGNYFMVSYIKTDSSFRVPYLSLLTSKDSPGVSYNLPFFQLTELTCDELNSYVERSIPYDILPIFVKQQDRDYLAGIMDKNGNSCNWQYTNYEGLVFSHDPTSINNFFMALPLSVNPVAALSLYAFNTIIGVWEEFERVHSIDPMTFNIRNGHLNNAVANEFVPDPRDEYACHKLPLTLRDEKEKLRQVSKSSSSDGLWIIGDKGLHYLYKDSAGLIKQYNFDFNQFGEGVTVSKNGKLIISASGAANSIGQIYLDRYDEKSILDYIKNNENESNYSINLDKKFKEGSFNARAHLNAGFVFPGIASKLYTSRGAGGEDLLYVSYRGSSRLDVDGALFTFNVNSLEPYSWLNNALDGQEINNFAIKDNGEIFYLPTNGGGLYHNIDYKFTPQNPSRVIDGMIGGINNNPFVLNIKDKVYAVLDDGALYQANLERRNWNNLTDLFVPLHYPLEDALGGKDNKFYLLNQKNLFECSMPSGITM